MIRSQDKGSISCGVAGYCRWP